MKNVVSLFLVALMVVGLTISCRRKSSTAVGSTEKKKYAWSVGAPDSTGYGMILFSPDGGDTWTRQGLGASAIKGINLGDVWAVDENNVWAIGDNNAVLKTSNGGQNWVRAEVPACSSNSNLMAISIVSKTNIWISGSSGTLYNSTDSGISWKLFDSTLFQSSNLQGVWAVSPEKVYVVGQTQKVNRGYISYTLDGGSNWKTLTPAKDYNRNQWIGVTSSGNTIVIYGSKAHYIVSTDSGTTWKNDTVPGTGGIDGADINHLIMLNPQTWWGAFDNGQIFITTNGGTSWTKQESGQGGSYLVGIDTWDGKLAIVVGAPLSMPPKSPIIKTNNQGALWVTKHTTKSTLWKVSFIKDR